MHVDALLQTLPIMAKGMAGIFLVTAVIIAAVLLLRGFSKNHDQKTEK